MGTRLRAPSGPGSNRSRARRPPMEGGYPPEFRIRRRDTLQKDGDGSRLGRTVSHPRGPRVQRPSPAAASAGSGAGAARCPCTYRLRIFHFGKSAVVCCRLIATCATIWYAFCKPRNAGRLPDRGRKGPPALWSSYLAPYSGPAERDDSGGPRHDDLYPEKHGHGPRGPELHNAMSIAHDGLAVRRLGRGLQCEV